MRLNDSLSVVPGTQPLSRRTWMRRMAGATTLAALSFWSVPRGLAEETQSETKPTAEQESAMAAIAHTLMEEHEAPGLSIAVARHGQFVYSRGFGAADKETRELVTHASLFRIASISKPITAVAIFTLIEAGRLRLAERVFGNEGILKFDYGDDYPENVKKITIQHLLNHTCGGWDNSSGIDPMFYKPEWNHEDLIRWAVHEQPLEHEPGTHFAYSNFGFCLLGRVIEKLTGKPYADFVRASVLEKCGISDMRLAGNTRAQRTANEVVYYGQKGAGTNPYDMNVTRMDAHGGWIATPSDLVRFAMHVDGFSTTPSLLRQDTIKEMTTPSAARPNYACGWFVNRIPNWWHSGSLPGTLTIMVRTASGLCWAAFTNTRANGLNLDRMMWDIVKCVPAWKA